MKTVPEHIQTAFSMAQNVRSKAHAPYSKLHVGAAIKVVGQNDLVVGCNVENASFGATICAERMAIGNMVAQFGAQSLEYLVLCSDSPSGVIPPCGMCLQVLQEFAGDDFPIYLGDGQQVVEKIMFSQLYPRNFKPEMLP